MAKSPIDKLLHPVHRFIHQEYTGSIVLFVSVVVAIVWANGPAAHSYHELWDTKLSVGFSDWAFSRPLHVWINDGLMAVFFFLIGLELKREFIAGELSTVREAALPMVASLGGMVVPALIYTAFNAGKDSAGGWGIPMATDIAFALGLLSLAGKRVPASLKIFLSALAVADDLGAVLVIAIFYTGQIAIMPLIIAGMLLLLLWLANVAGVRNTFFYLVVGIVIWYCFLLSGMHATIAGVLAAFMIPARTKVNEEEYMRHLKGYAQAFEEAIPLNGSLTTPEQHQVIDKIKRISLDAETPLQKIEHNLHPWITFLIMPLFALANAGIVLSGDMTTALANPVSMGVLTGLVVGKVLGVTLFTWIMVRLKLVSLPAAAGWKHILGVGLLAGVGFTMSLFITELAFGAEHFIHEAKYGILFASVISGCLGVLVLRRVSRGVS